jgi:hypothetical protein
MRRLAPLLLAGLLAGCGGGSPAGHGRLVGGAQRACAAARAQVTVVPRPAAFFGLARYLRRVVPVLRRERDSVAALPAAGADRARQRTLVVRWDAVLSGLAEISRGVRTGDDAVVAFGLKRTFRANEAAKPAARALGGGACLHFSPLTP